MQRIEKEKVERKYSKIIDVISILFVLEITLKKKKNENFFFLLIKLRGIVISSNNLEFLFKFLKICYQFFFFNVDIVKCVIF